MRQSCSRVSRRRAFWLASLLACALTPLAAHAEPSRPRIVCRAELIESRRAELSNHLRAITGWGGLHFDGGGALRFGAEPPSGGSQSARELLASAQGGDKFLVIEDASGSPDVAFSRVLEGRWKGDAGGRPSAFVVQIDFSDFSHVRGDRAALAAFNSGWGLLHEVEHAVRDSADPEGLGGAGECEGAVNRMRRECGLAERAEYFYTPLPGQGRSEFKTRFMRLAFEHLTDSGKTRRYWLLWDADLVGGLPTSGEVATR